MNRNSIAASLLATALLASALGAQDTTRKVNTGSRILISKGDVALPRVDTVFMKLFDTVYVRHVDTVYQTRLVPQTLVRVDTMTVPVERKISRNPFYAGLYTGMTSPAGDADLLYTNGVHVGALLGWDGARQLLGIRGRAEFAELGRQFTSTSTLLADEAPMMSSLGLDLKVMPLDLKGWRLYGVGGMSANSYRGLATVASTTKGVWDPVAAAWYTPAGSGWSTKLGFSAGAGADVMLGRHEMFLEARAAALQSSGAQTWTVPVSLGLRFF